jgi:hypothetical protein
MDARKPDLFDGLAGLRITCNRLEGTPPFVD